MPAGILLLHERAILRHTPSRERRKNQVTIQARQGAATHTNQAHLDQHIHNPEVLRLIARLPHPQGQAAVTVHQVPAGHRAVTVHPVHRDHLVL